MPLRATVALISAEVAQAAAEAPGQPLEQAIDLYVRKTRPTQLLGLYGPMEVHLIPTNRGQSALVHIEGQ